MPKSKSAWARHLNFGCLDRKACHDVSNPGALAADLQTAVEKDIRMARRAQNQFLVSWPPPQAFCCGHFFLPVVAIDFLCNCVRSSAQVLLKIVDVFHGNKRIQGAAGATAFQSLGG